MPEVKVSVWREFLWEYLSGKNKQDIVYLNSFNEDKQRFIDDYNFSVIVMPNSSKLVRIEK